MAIIYGRADSEKQLLDLYPKRVKEIDDIDKVEVEMQEELLAEAKGLVAKFRRWRLKKQYKKFEQKRDDPFHAGAKGENQVIDKLSRLDDEYHVLCGVRLGLSHYISYNGKKNLKSAQIDFVVVSKKGVYAIEVKNWSDKYLERQNYFSPHEQAGRAGRLLWHVLKSWRKTPRVTSVVLSIKGNIKYDPKYKVVFVSNINNINKFLENREDVLSDKEVEKIVKKLKDHVTK
ncbi:MAG: NERD domain-containing protein [Nitrosopumilaceae archaeon]|nr:NERD domain-containing protein [Nitrosopumilaceae archaeon]